MSDKKIFVGIKGEKMDLTDSTPKRKPRKSVKLKPENIIKPVRVSSQVNYPITIKYGDDSIVVSPRAKLKLADINKLGTLPKGIVVKEL